MQPSRSRQAFKGKDRATCFRSWNNHSLHLLHSCTVFQQLPLVGGELGLLGDLVSWNHIEQKVKGLVVCDNSCYVIPLQSLAVLLASIVGCFMRYLGDKHLACECEEDGCLGRYHPHIFVRLHNLLNPCQWQLLLLECIQIVWLLVDFLTDFLKFNRKFLHVLLHLWVVDVRADSSSVGRSSRWSRKWRLSHLQRLAYNSLSR